MNEENFNNIEVDLNANNTIDNTSNIISDSNTISENTIYDGGVVTLETIHNDLGFICTFLVIASVLIFMRMLYKLFRMFF